MDEVDNVLRLWETYKKLSSDFLVSINLLGTDLEYSVKILIFSSLTSK